MFVAADDPECPACGCRQSKLVCRLTRWGIAYTQRRCAHCGKVFTAPDSVENLTIRYNKVRCRCPRCGAVNPPVTSKKGRLGGGKSIFRQHRCEQCGATFQSVQNEE